MEEIVKMIIFVVILVVLIGGVILLFKGKGGDILASIKNFFRFGG